MTNYNQLNTTNFKFEIQGLPEVNYWLQSVSLPSLDLGASHFATPHNSIQLPGHELDYAPLILNFIVDEDLENYMTMVNWLRTFKTSDEPDSLTKDCTLTIMAHSGRLLKEFVFKHVYPLSIGELPFASDTEDTQAVYCAVTLNYSEFL
jgi:hypothetical protein